VQNLEIAAALTELADLLEIRGSNPFRIRAYRNVVRTVEGLTRPLAAMVAEGEDLTELQGVGKDMASHIRELVETGRLSRLEELWEEVPRSLVDLIRLEGVGPKKAKKIWEELDVTTVDELEAAIEAGRVEVLDGFGVKSTQKILQSIQDFRSLQGRFLLSEADALVTPLLEHLEDSPGVERVEVAGSYRRRKDTVGDVDILVLCEQDPAAVMERFTGFSGARRVVSAGETRGRILLSSGLPVDIRILPRRSYGAALHYFTGSKEHNVSVRALAVRAGLRVSEYGVFREEKEVEGAAESQAADPGAGAADPKCGVQDPEADTEDQTTGAQDPKLGAADPEAGERLGGEKEEDVFRAVDLPWIPPVLRENRGEVEAAREGRLPRLLELEDILGDLQMHSTWSDGKSSIMEMARACRDRGYEYLSLTDHSQAVTVANGLTPERVRRQWEEIDEIRERLEGIHLFRSLEVDILKDGSLDMPDEVLEGLDLVLVSVHSFMNMSQAEMTDRVIRGIQNPQVDILAHPTGRILNRRPPFEMDVEAVLQAAAEAKVAVELNAHPSRLDLHDGHVRRAKEMGVKVAVNTDAHSPRDLSLMSYGIDQARRGWLEPGDVLNAMSLRDFQKWRGRKRG